MRVSLEKGLKNLEEHLVNKGYEIVSENEVCDAYIYENTPISQIRAKNFSPISSLAEDPVLLVCAKGRTFDEIELTLNQKSYNKIF